MGLFDLFSGSSQKKASAAAIAALQAEETNATNALNTGKAEGLKAIDTGQQQSVDALQGGLSHAVDNYGAASALFDPYATTGTSAFNLYADATGANGADGYSRATSAFQDSPGYQKQVDDATDATARKFSALGALGSGNTVQAVTDRASDLANQEYQQYLGNLKNVADTGYAATGAKASLQKGIGDLYTGESQAESGVDASSASSRAGIDQSWGNGLAGVNTTTGGNVAPYIYKQGTADQDASKNLWNAVLGIGNTAASVLGVKAGKSGGLFS